MCITISLVSMVVRVSLLCCCTRERNGGGSPPLSDASLDIEMQRLDDKRLPLELEREVVLASAPSNEGGQFLGGRGEGGEMEGGVEMKEAVVGGEEEGEGGVGWEDGGERMVSGKGEAEGRKPTRKVGEGERENNKNAPNSHPNPSSSTTASVPHMSRSRSSDFWQRWAGRVIIAVVREERRRERRE